MKIVSIIPARGGSKGVPRKNIREVNSQPLIAYTILDSLRSKLIEETFVSTDSKEIKYISEIYGAEVPFLRPAKYASDTATDLDWVLHFLAYCKVMINPLPEYMVHLRATTPKRSITLIDKAITTLQANPDATALRSVEEFPESPLKWFKKKGKYLEPFNKDYMNAPRQEVPKVYRPNGYVDILKTSTLLKGELHGDKILAFVTPVSVEVDTEADFEQLHPIL